MTLLLNRKRVNFKSTADLNDLIVDNIANLPDGLDLIVAVPRSGYIVAGLIALNLNLPLCSYDEYLARSTPKGGRRTKDFTCVHKPNRKVLIVDDSVSSGWEMRRIRAEVAERSMRDELVFLAAYVNEEAMDLVDVALEITNPPQIFEWNLYHHPHLINSCIDIDGVLCRDARKDEDDDGEKYRQFIENVPPRIVPGVEIGWLVTSRLEKYREHTAGWLGKHGIKYRNLIMQDLPDLQSRLEGGGDARFKADVYSGLDALLFIESSSWQAKEIARRSGKAVFCVGGRSFSQAKTLEAKVGEVARTVSRIMSRTRDIGHGVWKEVSGRKETNSA